MIPIGDISIAKLVLAIISFFRQRGNSKQDVENRVHDRRCHVEAICLESPARVLTNGDVS